jgi:hypothetical protein
MSSSTSAIRKTTTTNSSSSCSNVTPMVISSTVKPKISTASSSITGVGGGAEKKIIPATVIKREPVTAAIVTTTPPVKTKTKTSVVQTESKPKTATKKQEQEAAESDEDMEEDESEDEDDDDDDGESIEEDEPRSEEEDDESEEEPEKVDVTGKCLLCTLDTNDLKPMFTTRMETDEKKKESILCEFCYQFLFMSFEVQGTCTGEHRQKEYEGVFLHPDACIKRQEDADTPVTYAEIKKMKRVCFDCIQDILPWNNREVFKTLRRAYRMIKSVAKNCPVCFENSVTVTNRGPRLRLCDLCKDDFQNAKNDSLMCKGLGCKGVGVAGKSRDMCLDCLKKSRERRLFANAESYRQRKTPELISRIQRENTAFCNVLSAYIANLKIIKPVTKARKKKEKSTSSTATASPPEEA